MTHAMPCHPSVLLAPHLEVPSLLKQLLPLGAAARAAPLQTSRQHTVASTMHMSGRVKRPNHDQHLL